MVSVFGTTKVDSLAFNVSFLSFSWLLTKVLDAFRSVFTSFSNLQTSALDRLPKLLLTNTDKQLFVNMINYKGASNEKGTVVIVWFIFIWVCVETLHRIEIEQKVLKATPSAEMDLTYTSHIKE